MIKTKDMSQEAIASRVAAVRELAKIEDEMGLWDEEIIPSDIELKKIPDVLEYKK